MASLNYKHPVNNLWAKSEPFISLPDHMLQSYKAAERIYQDWIPGSIQDVLENGLSEIAEKLVYFLAMAHDLGKATPFFQFNPQPNISNDLLEAVKDAGFSCPNITGRDWHAIHHSVASQLILEEKGIHRSVAIVLGGHHGKFPSTSDLALSKGIRQLVGLDAPEWVEAHEKLYFDALSLTGLSESELKNARLAPEQQMLFTGIVIMSDWIASGGDLSVLDELQKWDIGDMDFDRVPFDFSLRFGFTETEVQSAVIEAALYTQKPGIMIIEAPMGSGKTEAALAAAEILSSRQNIGGVLYNGIVISHQWRVL